MDEHIVFGILLVTGALTATLIAGVFLPDAFVRVLLGTTIPNATMRLVVRHWCLMIGMVGGLLLFAAYDPGARTPALIFATAEKLAFGAMVLLTPLRRRPLTLAAIGGDAVMALLYLRILFG